MQRSEWQLRATQRLVDLLTQLCEEEATVKKTGAQGRAADRVGIDRTLASRLLNGERTSVDVEQIESAARKVGLDTRYFFDEELIASDYRKYLQLRPAREAGMLEPLLNEREQVTMLRAMSAGALEIELWHAHQRLFKHRRITSTYVEAWLHGLRSRTSQ